MRTLRLDRVFYAVFVQDAVDYLTTEEQLSDAIETALVHLRPGGVALFHPDYVKDTFVPSTSHGGHDGDDGRGLRYLDWTWDPDRSDATYVSDMVYLLREADGRVCSVHDRHTLGLFSRADWLRLLTSAGFEARTIAFVHSEVAPSEVFVGVKAV